MSSGHHRITRRRNIAENFNRLSRVHERYRQTTDGRTTTYSKHEHEFTFANKHIISTQKCKYKYKTKHANITMKNLQIQVGVMETIILYMKTTTKGSKSLLQVANMFRNKIKSTLLNTAKFCSFVSCSYKLW